LDLITTLIISIGLAMDCFAVSLGIGTSPVPTTRRLIFRITYHFGLFQGGMAFLGWLAGTTVVQFISAFDHWIAFILLAYVGSKMIREGLSNHTEDIDPEELADPSRGRSLVMLSIATSIDALAVGLSLAFLQANILLSSLSIGVTSSLLSLVGLLVGKNLSNRFGKRMEILGGVILLLIGLRILISHLAGA